MAERELEWEQRNYGDGENMRNNKVTETRIQDGQVQRLQNESGEIVQTGRKG